MEDCFLYRVHLEKEERTERDTERLIKTVLMLTCTSAFSVAHWAETEELAAWSV